MLGLGSFEDEKGDGLGIWEYMKAYDTSTNTIQSDGHFQRFFGPEKRLALTHMFCNEKKISRDCSGLSFGLQKI